MTGNPKQIQLISASGHPIGYVISGMRSPEYRQAAREGKRTPTVKAFDREKQSLPSGWRPYFMCSDGILRTEAERSRFVKNGL